jgi:hypothetical protein
MLLNRDAMFVEQAVRAGEWDATTRPLALRRLEESASESMPPCATTGPLEPRGCDARHHAHSSGGTCPLQFRNDEDRTSSSQTRQGTGTPP